MKSILTALVAILIGCSAAFAGNPFANLKPENGYNFYFLTGFKAPAGLGLGAGMNRGYWSLNFDVTGPVGQHPGIVHADRGNAQYYIPVSHVQHMYQIGELKWAQPGVQIALSPGVNLRYFGLNVGLGTMLIRSLESERKPHGDIYGEESKGARFLARPTVWGRIPFKNSGNKGLILSVGYNIVGGISDMNQVVFGIGLGL